MVQAIGVPVRSTLRPGADGARSLMLMLGQPHQQTAVITVVHRCLAEEQITKQIT